MAFVFHFVDPGHADVLENSQVVEIVFREGHPEAGSLDGGDMFGEALQFLVVHKVHFLVADRGEVEGLVHREGIGLLPLAVFPIFAALGDLADVDLGIKVGGQRMAVVAGVGVHDVEVMDLVKFVLKGVGRKDRRYAGVEAAAKESGQTGLLEIVMHVPLPLVAELRFFGGLVVGGVDVVGAGH